MRDCIVVDNCGRSGRVAARPAKSVLHRRILAASLTAGRSLIEHGGFALSRDNQLTLSAVAELGLAHVEQDVDSGRIEIIGGLPPRGLMPQADCGDCGAALRFLIPAVLLRLHGARLVGSQRLFSRPLQPYLQLFRERGAVARLEADSLLLGGKLYPGHYQLPADVSSQFASGLLLTLPLLEADSRLSFTQTPSSRAYIELTLSLLADCGLRAAFSDELNIDISGNQRYRPCEQPVAGDYSHAAFFLAAGALSGPVSVSGLPESDCCQADAAIVDILRDYGARVYHSQYGLTVAAGERRPLRLEVDQYPDLAPVLALLAALAPGESRLLRAGRLRYKESDRLQALAEMIDRLGAFAQIRGDDLIIRGCPQLRGGYVEHYNDHRLAMALAAVAGVCRSPLVLLNDHATDKSAPEFWQQFDSLAQGRTVRTARAEEVEAGGHE